MTMNNGPASVPCLVAVVIPQRDPAEAVNPFWGVAVRVQCASGITCSSLWFAVSYRHANVSVCHPIIILHKGHPD